MKNIIKVGNVECGADKLFLIAGPCVVEDEKTMMDTAEFLVNLSQKLDLPLIFKSSFQKDNRSSSDFYSGPGLHEGLAMLQKIKETFNVPLITDIHYPDQIAATAAGYGQRKSGGTDVQRHAARGEQHQVKRVGIYRAIVHQGISADPE